MIAEVIINRTAKKLNRTFDYAIPKELEDFVIIGSKVLVPFGKGGKLEEAFVTRIKDNTEFKVKEIAKIENSLDEKKIELAKWMANRYFCNISDCIKLMLTPGTRGKEKKAQEKIIRVVYLKKKKDEITIRSSAAEYLTYVASVGDQQDSIEMRYEDENIWLTQKMMATLYDVDVRTINEHIKKIYSDSELEEEATIRNFRIVQTEGSRQVTRDTKHYNLQMIIAVGFKVNNERAVQFRKWTNGIVKDYTIKGWVMDDERLKNGGSVLTTEYFDRLLEQIREIRLSERRFYQKITDIYATALDYDRTAKTTKQFFAKVQNKMHYAVHGHTAAELIYERADADKPHMGLTTWATAPEGKIVKSDVSVAKNYLSEQEMRSLERIVSAYLDLAEDRAERHIPMTMEDWAKRLDLFLMADDREVLQDAGKITAEIAKAKAETEFEKYRVIQDRLFMSDFDKYMLELEENAKK